VHDPVSAAAMGLIPVEVIPIELDIKNYYESYDRRPVKRNNRKNISPQVCLVCNRGHLALTELMNL
jgi:hypothetical protein